jgi:hypothetical protein
MRRVRLMTVILSTCIACASGGSTHVETSWRSPDARPLTFNRILAAYVTTDSSVRRSAENHLAERIPNSFPAYRSLPTLAVGDDATARVQLHEKLFDGAIVMRVVSVEDRKSYVPDNSWYSTYPTFYSYWGSSWGMVHAPGYVVTDKVVTVETAVYSLVEDKLVWAGRTQIANPGSIGKLVDKTTGAVAKELRKQGLIL